VATLRRRETAVEETRPEYAKNIEQRRMLAAELKTAREAQLRVLPRRLPQIEGLTVAALHAGSAEVGADYYELFASDAKGRIGIAVADTSLKGLSSALCVSMLKGLLLNYTARFDDPAEIVGRIQRHLTAVFGDDLPLSLTYATLTRESGELRFATFGSAPRMIHLRDGQAAAQERIDATGSLHVGASDRLLFYTDGLPATSDDEGSILGDDTVIAEVQRAGAVDAERLVETVARAAERHARGSTRDHEWTVLAIAVSPAEGLRA
jgi:sigma-B regulation protein RsbU (phosphoserine phosphatase)